jgi:hypothetical protein
MQDRQEILVLQEYRDQLAYRETTDLLVFKVRKGLLDQQECKVYLVLLEQLVSLVTQGK